MFSCWMDASQTFRLLKEAGGCDDRRRRHLSYGRDPRDSNIRIAPTYPSLEEIRTASDLFCICAEMASHPKLLEKEIRTARAMQAAFFLLFDENC